MASFGEWIIRCKFAYGCIVKQSGSTKIVAYLRISKGHNQIDSLVRAYIILLSMMECR